MGGEKISGEIVTAVVTLARANDSINEKEKLGISQNMDKIIWLTN